MGDQIRFRLGNEGRAIMGEMSDLVRSEISLSPGSGMEEKLCEHRVRRQLCTHQKEGSDQELNLLIP